MSNKLKKITKIIVFAVILIIILFLLTIIFNAKFTAGLYRTTSTVVNFYEEPEDTLDVLFFGTSFVAHGVSPLYIWDEFGFCHIRSHLGGSSQ